MTQEEKQILLIDLSVRLPYGVKFALSGNGIYTMKGIDLIVTDEGDWEYAIASKGIAPIEIMYVKPYLRPMSSMTTEEEYEYHQCKNIDYLEICEMKHTEMLETAALCFSRATDWLNKNGFDYRGLIPMGLALEASADMYK